MATIRSQLNKYEEQVEECRRYQKFLDSVTPVEWQEQQKQALVARQNQRHAAWLLDCEALKKQKQDAKGEVSRWWCCCLTAITHTPLVSPAHHHQTVCVAHYLCCTQYTCINIRI